jgi:glutathione synthase/RimK-type ligase-like ATP-grasp enzyme
MHQNIKILREALASIRISYGVIEGFPDALMVGGYSFVRATTPFNDESIASLCKDKDAVHKLLRGAVPMPLTKSFLDPQGRHPELAAAKSIEDIMRNSSEFIYPRIIKMNQGEKGRNVFMARNEDDARAAFETIFNKESKYYDYIALVQEYIEPKKEWRVLVSAGRPVLCYDRVSKQISKDTDSSRILELSNAILKRIPLFWGSVDFIESKNGSLYFLEINSRPEFDEENPLPLPELVKIYESALSQFIRAKHISSRIP